MDPEPNNRKKILLFSDGVKWHDPKSNVSLFLLWIFGIAMRRVM